MLGLRPMEPADKWKVRDWRNLPEVAKYMYKDHHISVEEHERWFSSALTDSTRRYWIIVVDGEDVGLVNLYNIDEANRRCHWAFYLASPNVRGKGVGSLVEYTILRRVFVEMALNKLCCEVLDFNEAVVQMHKGFGFREEGRLRQHIFKRGQPHDVVVLGMLREEWELQQGAIEQRLRDKGLL